MTSIRPNYTTHLDVGLLADALKSNDDLTIVLRGHMELERAMVRVLDAKFPKYSCLAHNSFAQHLRAFRALGATGPIFQIADQANKIRNSLVHTKNGNVKTTLTAEDLHHLCAQSSGAFGGLRDVLDVVTQLGSEGPKPLREFGRAKQFLVITAMAAAAIDAIPQREVEAA